MRRRDFLATAGVTGAALALYGCGTARQGTPQAQEARRSGAPNIIFILADDLGYGDLGCYGSEHIVTPNLDALAKDGLRFTHFYVNAPVCSPSRAAFLTGRSPARCGAGSVFTPANPEGGLPVNETTVAEVLRDGGYATGIFGKWHLGYTEAFNPVNRGFDRFVGNLSGFLDYQTHVNPRFGYDWWDGLEKKDEPGYSTDLISKHSIEFVRAHKNRPFFLFVSHQAPHSPYQGPGDAPQIEIKDGQVVKHKVEMSGEERFATYGRMIERMDKAVGDLVAVLREEGLAENTLVMFVSDNGPSWLAGSTGGLNGGKHNLWEGGIRIPAVAWWPGRIGPGAVTDQPCTTLDLFPTFLGFAGIDRPSDLELEGTDIGGLLLKGSDLPSRVLCWEYRGGMAAREGRWKLMAGYSAKEQKIVVKGLYDLVADVSEKSNVAEENPETVARLKAALENWRASIAADKKLLARGDATTASAPKERKEQAEP